MKNLEKKMKKCYRERVKQRMGKYYEEKPLKKVENNMKETMYVPNSTDAHVVKRKIAKAAPLVHPQNRKKELEVKMAKKFASDHL